MPEVKGPLDLDLMQSGGYLEEADACRRPSKVAPRGHEVRNGMLAIASELLENAGDERPETASARKQVARWLAREWRRGLPSPRSDSISRPQLVVFEPRSPAAR